MNGVRVRALVWGLLFAVGCESEPTGSDAGTDAGPLRCLEDGDCAEREACNAQIGVCYPLDACDDERPCPEGQACLEGDDGYFACVFDRCTSDEACAGEVSCGEGELPRCQAGACGCGMICPGGCDDGLGCCHATAMCQALPEACADTECPLGEGPVRTSTGTWSGASCALEGEVCACQPLAPLPWGDIGRQSSLARDGDRAVIAAYNLTYGDLMFGELRPGPSVDWRFVDGVPTSSASVTGALDGPRGGRSAPGPDVGQAPRVVLSGGTAWVAYQNATDGEIRMLRESGGQVRHHRIVERASRFSDLSVDDEGHLLLAYLIEREGPPTARRAVLRLARSTSASPEGPDDWSHEDVVVTELAAADCRTRCDGDEVCVAGACRTVDPTPCQPACGEGTACLDARCQPVEARSTVRSLPELAGLWPRVRAAGSEVLVAWYDNRDRSLRLARNGAGAWVTMTVAGGEGLVDRGEDAGRFVDLELDDGGQPHLVYLNRTRGQIRWVSVAGETAEAATISDEPMNFHRPALLEGELDLLLPAQGPARVAYPDARRGVTRLATRREGAWAVEDVVVPPGASGFQVQLARDPDGAVWGTAYRFQLTTDGDTNGLVIFSAP